MCSLVTGGSDIEMICVLCTVIIVHTVLTRSPVSLPAEEPSRDIVIIRLTTVCSGRPRQGHGGRNSLNFISL